MAIRTQFWGNHDFTKWDEEQISTMIDKYKLDQNRTLCDTLGIETGQKKILNDIYQNFRHQCRDNLVEVLEKIHLCCAHRASTVVKLPIVIPHRVFKLPLTSVKDNYQMFLGFLHIWTQRRINKSLASVLEDGKIYLKDLQSDTGLFKFLNFICHNSSLLKMYVYDKRFPSKEFKTVGTGSYPLFLMKYGNTIHPISMDFAALQTMRLAVNYNDVDYVETDYEYYFQCATMVNKEEKDPKIMGINIFNPFLVDKEEERKRRNPTQFQNCELSGLSLEQSIGIEDDEEEIPISKEDEEFQQLKKKARMAYKKVMEEGNSEKKEVQMEQKKEILKVRYHEIWGQEKQEEKSSQKKQIAECTDIIPVLYKQKPTKPYVSKRQSDDEIESKSGNKVKLVDKKGKISKVTPTSSRNKTPAMSQSKLDQLDIHSRQFKEFFDDVRFLKATIPISVSQTSYDKDIVDVYNITEVTIYSNLLMFDYTIGGQRYMLFENLQKLVNKGNTFALQLGLELIESGMSVTVSERENLVKARKESYPRDEEIEEKQFQEDKENPMRQERQDKQ